MPRQRTPNLYVFFKSKVSRRRALALFAEHNLTTLHWLPNLNGHGLYVPAPLLPAVRQLLDGHPLVVALMTKNPQGILRRIRTQSGRGPRRSRLPSLREMLDLEDRYGVSLGSGRRRR